MTKKITLTKGYSAIVDDIDYNYLNQWKWHALVASHNLTYAVRKPDKHIRMQRVIVERKNGHPIPQGMVVDHINRQSLDNRRSNLRLGTRGQNNCNRGKCRKKTSSRFKGTHRFRKKWQAAISVNGKNIYLGLFESEEDAAHRYDQAAKEYYGEFALLNFPAP